MTKTGDPKHDSVGDVVRRYWAAINANDFQAAGQLLHDDFLLHWPQSGERICGRANFVSVNEHYPAAGPWRVTVHRLLTEGDEVASEVTVTDGVLKATAITFSNVLDGRIVRQTEYWPDPFEAAPWRAGWVERSNTANG